jgi:periplasmic protein TonB
MARPSLIDELDQAIDTLVAHPDSAPSTVDDSISGMVQLAAELRCLPHPDFKGRLLADLERRAALMALRSGSANESLSAGSTRDTATHRLKEHEDAIILPSLFGTAYGQFSVHRVNFLASFALHAAAVAFILSSGLWMVGHRDEMKHELVTLVAETSPYAQPIAKTKSGGGGGGGDADKLSASRGAPPRFERDQITPPAVVLHNNQPKIAADPTLVGPPNLNFAKSQTGDPLASVLSSPSNGTGFGGGIGSGAGGGIGSGYGPGIGPGRGGGFGGGIYRVGGGVTAPRAVYDPDPEYSDEARKARYQGSVILWVVVGPDGRPRDLHIQRSLGMGLDEKAIEAVRKWRFEPAMKDGHPVAVQINVEVNFRLY